MSYGAIYKITNKESGMCYIGKTTDPYCRWNNQKRKFNEEEYEFEIIAEYNNERDLQIAERQWISFYDSINNGYNKTKGGDGNCVKVIKIDDNQTIFLGHLRKNGNTYYTTIPIDYIRGMKLNKKDIIKITIEKMKGGSE